MLLDNLRKLPSRASRLRKNVTRSLMNSTISRISQTIKRLTRLSCRESSQDWKMIRFHRFSECKNLSMTTKHSKRKVNSKSKDLMNSNRLSNRKEELNMSMRCRSRISRGQTEMQSLKPIATNFELKACNSILKTILSME